MKFDKKAELLWGCDTAHRFNISDTGVTKEGQQTENHFKELPMSWMFWKRSEQGLDGNQPENTEEIQPTFLGKELNIKGKIQGSDDVLIMGKHEGDLDIEAKLDIRHQASIHGNIKANVIIVGGNVQGDLTARNRLQVSRTGKIKGDMTTPQVSIKSGAVFNGKLNMKLS